MELNLYGTATAGAVLGLDGQSNWIVLARRLSVDALDVSRIEQALLKFMATAEHLARQLQLQPKPEAADAGIMATDELSVIRA
jgi:hypothetical protein